MWERRTKNSTQGESVTLKKNIYQSGSKPKSVVLFGGIVDVLFSARGGEVGDKQFPATLVFAFSGGSKLPKVKP